MKGSPEYPSVQVRVAACRQVQSLWMMRLTLSSRRSQRSYIYNSFQEPILAKVLSNLAESLARVPRELVIASVNPVSDELLLTLKGIQLAHRRLVNIYSHGCPN